MIRVGVNFQKIPVAFIPQDWLFLFTGCSHINLAIPANKKIPCLQAKGFFEVGGGFEPPYAVLQTAA